jgi:hypothetical protein
MTSHPNQPVSDEADPEKETSPAGVARDLERKADELGATTGPPDKDAAAEDPDSPGATIDQPSVAEPNEPG